MANVISIRIEADGSAAIVETKHTTAEIGKNHKELADNLERLNTESADRLERLIKKTKVAQVNAEVQRILAAEKSTAQAIAIAEKEAVAKEQFLNRLRAESVRQETQRIIAAEQTALKLKEIRAGEVASANAYATSNRGASSDRLQGSFDTLGLKSALNIEAEKARIIAAFNQIKNSGTASAREISAAHQSMKEKLKSLDAPINNTGSMFTRFGAIASGAVAAFSAQSMITQLYQAGSLAERLRNSYEAATGSVARGAAEQGYARYEAYRLGLELQTVSSGYMKLTANAKGTILEGEKTRQIFNSVSGASRALALTNEETNGIIRAMGQIMSKGTVQSEELKSQIGEHLPGAFQIAARAMGVSTAQLEKMLEAGQVISTDFLPKFAAELQKTFPPGEKAMAGMSAETMRLKTAWYELKTTVMTNGGESIFTDSIRGMKNLVVEADSFYSRMAGAYRLLKEFAKNPMNPDLGGKPAQKNYAPVSQTDMLLISPDYGIADIRLKPDVSPDFGALAKREYSIDFGSTLTRDNAPEKGKAARKIRTQKPTDLLLKQILSYDSDMGKLLAAQEKKFFELGQELDAGSKSAAAVFNINTMQTGDLKTDRYNPTPLSQYRLRTNKQYSLPQAPPDAAAEQQAALEARRMETELNRELLAVNQNPDQQRAARLQESLDAELEQRITQAEKLKATEEEKWDMMLKAEEVYNAKKARIAEVSNEGNAKSLENSVGQMSNMLMQGNKKQFEAGKRMAQTLIAIDTAKAASAAFAGAAAAGGPWGVALGVAAGVAAIGVGAMNMARLEAVQYQARALGGPVTGGTTYLVGERGPELFTPGASGQITSNDKLASLGGSGQSVNTTHVWQISTGVTDTTRAEIVRMLPLIEQRVMGSMLRAINSGGAFSAAVGRA